ncbi:MAG: hypothetical protein NWF10_04390 [Candidatus Bathyarchaeota archaeon]|nr:hypothetical protein [Candidatus Bathyarchaeota archaeon]
MYNELYNAWKYEIENEELGSLALDFYSNLSDYIDCIREENDDENRKSVKSSLLLHELTHVTCMIEELISTRYIKLIKIIDTKKKLPLSALSTEEKKVFSNFLSFIKEYKLFRNNLMQGTSSKANAKKPPKRVVLRILKDIPALIGSDMKSYGPFLVEDVASLPSENAELLIKQGLGKLVETN